MCIAFSWNARCASRRGGERERGAAMQKKGNTRSRLERGHYTEGG
jgi:hypothetical protein